MIPKVTCHVSAEGESVFSASKESPAFMTPGWI
jgi:hypothetical protein